MKKSIFLNLILIMMLLISSFNFAAPMSAEKGLITRWETKIKSDKELVVPFEEDLEASVSTSDVAFGKMDGKNVAFIPTKGSGNYPGYFNVVDIETGELLFSETMKGATQSWAVLTVDKNVFIGTTGQSAALWQFDTVSKELVQVQSSLLGIKTLFTLSTDGQRIFGGGWPTGKVFEYHIETGEFKDLGIADLGGREQGIDNLEKPEEYVRSSSIYKDTLFVGTGSQNGRIMYRNINEEDSWKLLEMPVNEDFIDDVKDMEFIYDINVVNDHLYAFANGNNKVFIYDLVNEKWLDTRIENVRGQVGVSNAFNGKLFYSNRETKELGVFDLESMSVEDAAMSFDSNLRSTEVIHVDGEERFYTIDFNGSLKYFSYRSGDLEIKTQETKAKGQPAAIQSVHYDSEHDLLFASGYMGSRGYRRKLAEGKGSTFKLGQIENMDSADGKIYFGEYPAARIFEMDLKEETLEPQEILSLKDQKQDRPYRVLIDGKKLYIGTIAGYGSLQGALSIYDLETGHKQVFDNLVKDHSIVGIAVEDDYVYASTTRHGGLGVEADPNEQAQVFKFNLKTEKIEQVRSLDELKQNIPMISGLHINGKGQLLGFANGTIFELNKDTLEVIRHEVMYPEIQNFGKWRPVDFMYHEDILYANPGFKITAIQTDDFMNSFIQDSDKFVISNEGKIIYADEITLKEIDFELEEVEELVPEYEDQVLEVENGDFSLVDEHGKPQNWQPYFDKIYPNVGYELDDKHVKTKGKSLKIYDKNASASMFVKSAPIEIEVGELYEAQTYLYLENGRSSFMMRFYDDAGKQVGKDIPGESLVHKNDNEHNVWSELKVKGKAPHGAKYLRLVVGTNNAATTDGAYYDHVSLIHKKLKSEEVRMNVYVPNHSFEQTEFASRLDQQIKPKDWESLMQHEVLSDQVYFYQSTQQKTDGEKSLYVYDKDSKHSMFVASKPVPVLAGDKYELVVDAFYESQLYSSRRSQYLLRFYDEKGKIINEKVETYPASGNTLKWNELKLTALAPEKAKSLRIILGSNNASATDGIYYDNVRLTRITENPEVQPELPKQEVKLRESLLNPSFEELDAYDRIIGWTSLLNHESSSDNVYYKSSAENFTDGKRSVYLYDKDNNKSMYLASDPVKVDPMVKHQALIDLYMVPENNDARNFKLLLRYYDDEMKQVKEEVQLVLAKNVKGKWAEMSVASQAPKEASSVRVIFGTSNSGSNQVGSYVDRVRLVSDYSPVLEKEINRLRSLDLEIYSKDTVLALEERLEELEKTLDKSTIDKDEFEEIMSELSLKERELIPLDYRRLENLILEARAIDLDKMTYESSYLLEELLEIGQGYLEDKHELQKDLDLLADKIEFYIAELKQVDYSKLLSLIEKIEQLDENFYEASSLKGLYDLADQALEMIENQTRRQKDLDDMTIEIFDYLANSIDEIKTSDLQAMVDLLESIDLSSYTEKSVEDFKAALIQALDLLKNPKQSQKLVDKALQDLKNAKKELRKKEAIELDSSGNLEEKKDNQDQENIGVDNNLNIKNKSPKNELKNSGQDKNLPLTGKSNRLTYLAGLMSFLGLLILLKEKF